jgi:hypothetical protein
MAIAPSYVEAAFYSRVVRNGLIASAALLYLIAAIVKVTLSYRLLGLRGNEDARLRGRCGSGSLLRCKPMMSRA